MSKHPIQRILYRVLCSIFIVMAFNFADVPRAKSGGWIGSMPPAGSGNFVSCPAGQGVDCAIQTMVAWYGPPLYILSCDRWYNFFGQISLTVCWGQYSSLPLQRQGIAFWDCALGEIRSGADDCAAPQDKNAKACGPNNSSVFNPVNSINGVKFEEVVDFTTEGPSPLAFKRTYFSDIGAWAGPQWINRVSGAAGGPTSMRLCM